ncbi:putative nucleoside triphosphate pyrophosphohydrolase [Vibrio phage 393E50-1]|nr:putative nucleoside triphosphate pyrophosphohydrolase [Vibrio phage 393E50-1]
MKHYDNHLFYFNPTQVQLVAGKTYFTIVQGSQREFELCAKWDGRAWVSPIDSTSLVSVDVVAVYVEPTMKALQSFIHNQNIKVGWWDKPRTYSTFTNLFHSEASEALEGDRKSLMDDKLPQYPMPVVEAADLAIRILDYLGNLCNEKFTDSLSHPQYQQDNFQWNLAMCHYWVSQAWFSKEMVGEQFEHYLRHALRLAMYIIEDHDFDAKQIILKKVAFNLNRPDHQRENRQGKPGQKEY